MALENKVILDMGVTGVTADPSNRDSGGVIELNEYTDVVVLMAEAGKLEAGEALLESEFSVNNSLFISRLLIMGECTPDRVFKGLFTRLLIV